MNRTDFSWMIGGVQGSGVDTSANIFAKAAAQGGLWVYGKREYYSNIKGDHSYFQVRLSKEPVHSHVDTVDMLATFDDETIARHAWEVRRDGGIVYDPNLGGNSIDNIPTLERNVREYLEAELSKNGVGKTINDVLEVARRKGVHVYAIPYMDILKKVGEKFGDASLSALTRMLNVMAVAASFALLDYSQEKVNEALKNQFKAKPKVVEINIAAVSAAYDYVREKYNGGFGIKLQPIPTNEKRMFLRGSNTVGIAKILSGCRLQTYYPITPASDESEYLEAHESFDLDGVIGGEMKTMQEMQKGSVVVLQSEDEIAAITMAVGGGLAGVRSATSTSGPGFCLMAEGLGWAGINETPVVVTLYQRGGPSTGLPTRHEQGDLQFALHIGHGESPRFVLASGDLEETFYDVTKAFNYAERYQTAVVHLIDKALANSDQTYLMFDPNKAKIDRGLFYKGGLPNADGGDYERFKFTENGISPRPALGTKGGIHWTTGDEHDEHGHITEDPKNRIMMMEKRMNKLELADKEIPMEEKVHFFGPTDADITIVSWGSTKGAIIDALEWLQQDGIKVNFLQVRLMNPFPTQYVKQVLSRAKTIVDIEMNYSGQLGSLIREKTCVPIDQFVVKYNGRPMSCEEIYSAVKSIKQGKAPKRVVLSNGA